MEMISLECFVASIFDMVSDDEITMSQLKEWVDTFNSTCRKEKNGLMVSYEREDFRFLKTGNDWVRFDKETGIIKLIDRYELMDYFRFYRNQLPMDIEQYTWFKNILETIIMESDNFKNF
jgi:hypothetical protein